MDRDFVLNIEKKSEEHNAAYFFKNEDNGFIQLDMTFEKDAIETDLTQKEKIISFVLDCSGSMSGDSIEEAKKAIEICLKAMDKNTFFNIYFFGSAYRKLFNDNYNNFLPYNEDNLTIALNTIKETSADMGGTEILSPLKELVSESAVYYSKNKIKTDIILITDGGVSNENETFSLIENNSDNIRLFSVGIGAGCNEHCIKGLARAGKGISDFIYPGERIEPKIIKLFNRINSHQVENIKIKYDGNDLEQAPSLVTAYSDMPVTLYAKTAEQDFSGKKILVTGFINEKEIKRELNLFGVDEKNGNLPAPQLWAREKIRDLEERNVEKGSKQKERKNDKTLKTIIDISKKYGVLSKSTSFIAIEERTSDEKSSETMVLRKIPVAITAGWHGIGSVNRALKYSNFSSSRQQTPQSNSTWKMNSQSFNSKKENRPNELQCCIENSFCRDFDKDRWYYKRSNPDATNNVNKNTDDDIIIEILSNQKKDGGIELTDKLAKLLYINISEVQEAAKKLNLNIRDKDFLVVSTAIILEYLKISYPDFQRDYGSVIKKSIDWLNDIIENVVTKIDDEELADWAKKFVSHSVIPSKARNLKMKF